MKKENEIQRKKKKTNCIPYVKSHPKEVFWLTAFQVGEVGLFAKGHNQIT